MTLPNGLVWCDGHGPQHATGKESPAAKKTSAPVAGGTGPAGTKDGAGGPGTSGSGGDPGGGAGPQKPPVESCGQSQMLMIGLMLFAFYFFLLRPQQKQEKAAKQMRGTLKKGDRIVTSGGLHGVIVEVDAQTVTIQTDPEGRARMTFDLSAVGRTVSDESDAGAPDKPAG